MFKIPQMMIAYVSCNRIPTYKHISNLVLGYQVSGFVKFMTPYLDTIRHFVVA